MSVVESKVIDVLSKLGAVTVGLTVTDPTRALALTPDGVISSFQESEVVMVTVPTFPFATKLFGGVTPVISLKPTGS